MSIWMHMLLIAVLLYMIYGAYVAKSFYEESDRSWGAVFFFASCVILWLPYALIGNLIFGGKDKD